MKPKRTPDPMARATHIAVVSQNPSSLALCGARTRQGGECRHAAMANGRCRFHGGLSTGPKTAAGLARWRAAITIHGGRSREMMEFRRRLRELQADARRLVELA